MRTQREVLTEISADEDGREIVVSGWNSDPVSFSNSNFSLFLLKLFFFHFHSLSIHVWLTFFHHLYFFDRDGTRTARKTIYGHMEKWPMPVVILVSGHTDWSDLLCELLRSQLFFLSPLFSLSTFLPLSTFLSSCFNFSSLNFFPILYPGWSIIGIRGSCSCAIWPKPVPRSSPPSLPLFNSRKHSSSPYSSPGRGRRLISDSGSLMKSKIQSDPFFWFLNDCFHAHEFSSKNCAS